MNVPAIITKPTRALVLASGLIAATSIIGFAQDATVSLGTAANYPMTNAYLNPPSGTVTLGGHTFDMTSGNMILVRPGQSVSLSGTWANASSVYLLINSYNTYIAKAVGRVVLTFSDGTSQTTTLVAGANIREWHPIATTVNTATSTDLVNVWSETETDGSTSIIDMLTVPGSALTTAPRLTYRTITSISVLSDTAGDGPWATGIIISGVTVDPIAQSCIRPGNSINSINACDHSQAANNSQSANFSATGPTAPGQVARTDGTPANANTKGHDHQPHGHKSQ